MTAGRRDDSVKVAEFDYSLPEELIAQVPVEPRDSSRLLVMRRDSGDTEHTVFREIPRYLREGDLLVLNNTRVIRARLLGHKETGGSVEVFLLRRLEGDLWEVLVRPGKRLRPGARVSFAGGELQAIVEDVTGFGGRTVRLIARNGDVRSAIERTGHVPLPPYIHRGIEDPGRYQTVYASEEGSVAAPTAGLHFTTGLLDRVRSSGISTVFLTLHVGLGTFRPVQVEDVEEHEMHAEYYSIGDEATRAINETRSRGGRVVAVGTTAVRTLETAAGADGLVSAGSGWTRMFIYPGYRFKVISGLVTNFHLPRSTLLMLVCAFGGTGNVLRAYAEAVRMRYRFYSFGDAMLVI